jgi:hypothetical protein
VGREQRQLVREIIANPIPRRGWVSLVEGAEPRLEKVQRLTDAILIADALVSSSLQVVDLDVAPPLP